MTVGAMAAHPHAVAAMAVEVATAAAVAAGEPALQLHRRGADAVLSSAVCLQLSEA